MQPLDLDHLPVTAWPDTLRPLGESTHAKEPFDAWWSRNREVLAHLPADLIEQWIYRHWTHSPFSFLPPETLFWERRIWDGKVLLAAIHRAWGGELHPQFDYDVPRARRCRSSCDGGRA